MSKVIAPLDLMWLLIETANVPTHVGAVMLFERPAGSRPDFVSGIVRQYRAATPRPPFDCVPDLVHGGVPRWMTARSVDLDYHVQHLVLPAGATEATFVRLLEDLHEPMLDRNRPLFRMWAIEGLPDGRFAIYLKAHHSMIDGVSASMRIAASMSPSAAEPLRPPFFAVQIDAPRPRPSRDLVARVSALNETAWRQTSAVTDLSVNLLKRTMRRLLSRVKGDGKPLTAKHLPLNEPLRTPRSFAMLTLPLEEMRAVGHAFGGTINDVAATVVDAGAHRFLVDLGVSAKEPLFVMCPVSLRDAEDKAAATKATAIFVPLGAPQASIGQRMEQVIASINAGKDDLRAMTKDAAMMYAISALGIATAAEFSRIGRVTGHIANVVLSNVPGSTRPLYLAGARLAGSFPISALGLGVGLNVTLTSYDGRMDFGIVANRAAMPDVSGLARYTGEAFERLKAAAAQRMKEAPKEPTTARAKAGRAAAASGSGEAARRRTRPAKGRRLAGRKRSA